MFEVRSTYLLFLVVLDRSERAEHDRQDGHQAQREVGERLVTGAGHELVGRRVSAGRCIRVRLTDQVVGDDVHDCD